MMNTQNDDQDPKQLLQLSFWLMFVSTTTTIFYLAIWFLFPLPLVSYLLMMGFTSTVSFGVAYWLVKQGRHRTTIYLISSTITGLSLLSMFLVPELLPALVLMPVLAITITLPYLKHQMLRTLSVITVALAAALTLVSQHIRLLEPLPKSILDPILAFLVPAATALVVLLLLQSYARQRIALEASSTANAALRELQASLESQVHDRTKELQHAVDEIQARAEEQSRLNQAVAEQREAIRELSVPILPVSAQTLVMPLVGALDTTRLHEIQERALSAVEEHHAARFIVDITGVPVVDTQVAQGLIRVVQATKLLGATTFIVGVRPEVAQALVGLGIELDNVRTFATLEAALSSAGSGGKAHF